MTLNNLTLKTPYLTLDEEFYNLTTPTPLQEPYLINFNYDAAKLIDLDFKSEEEALFISILNGTTLIKGSNPFSMCYAGHQFGNYNPRLGDGRVANLGSINKWNLQVKGCGETFYSRMDDGRSALPSSIREYLMSEAMHHLNIPTTRALGIIGSKTKLLRNGMQNAAIVMRMSTSWVRFGTFEYFFYRGEHLKVQMLADYVLNESYAHLKNEEEPYFKMFCEIVERTATLVSKWQGAGFNHGVMNTDNMSIEGLTLDYGPFSMLDDFDYNHVCNNSDKAGRYAYSQQANISYWNLTKLSNALSKLISKSKMQKKLDDYGEFIYPNAYINVMKNKLGLFQSDEKDAHLIEELIITLQDVYVDYTLFFRTLSRYNQDREILYDIVMEPIILDKWINLYDKRLAKEDLSQSKRQEVMLKTNPKYVLKNYMLEEAIVLAKRGDYSRIEILKNIAQTPYDEHEEYEHFSQDTPEVHNNITLSCSS